MFHRGKGGWYHKISINTATPKAMKLAALPKPHQGLSSVLPAAAVDTTTEKLEKLDAAIKKAVSKLSARQRRFIEEFVSHGNAARAAQSAGYSERSVRVIASENLTKPNIKKAVALLGWRHELRVGIRSEWKRGVLAQTINRCMEQDPIDSSGIARCVDLLNRMDGTYLIDKKKLIAGDDEDELAEVLGQIEGQPMIQACGNEAE